MKRSLAVIFLLAAIVFVPQQALPQSVVYPLASHLNAAGGTIEFWLRLDVKPDPSGKDGTGYFPIFEIWKKGETQQRIRFSYGNVWKPDWFHFSFSTVGMLNGELVANPYVTTAEDTQTTTK